MEKWKLFRDGKEVRIGCNLPCEWMIHSSGDPTSDTYSCTDHLGEMMDDSKEHLITPYGGWYEKAPVGCCYILPTAPLPLAAPEGACDDLGEPWRTFVEKSKTSDGSQPLDNSLADK